MSFYLILWLTIASLGDEGGVSSHAQGGLAIALSVMGSPVSHIPFADAKACRTALERVTARAPFLSGVCVATGGK